MFWNDISKEAQPLEVVPLLNHIEDSMGEGNFFGLKQNGSNGGGGKGRSLNAWRSERKRGVKGRGWGTGMRLAVVVLGLAMVMLRLGWLRFARVSIVLWWRVVRLVAAFRGGIRVGSLTFVFNIGHIATFVSSSVWDHLDATIRQVHSIGSLEIATGILLLSLIKTGACMLINHSILVSVWGGNVLVASTAMRGVRVRGWRAICLLMGRGLVSRRDWG